MNKNIKVTFIMMAYNTEKYIEKAVRSVLNQTVKEITICVRNNGSTDRTGEILRKLAEEDNRVYVVENTKNGITDTGITYYENGWWPLTQERTGEYISILDSDDYLEPDFVEKLYKQAKANDADITAAGNWFVSEYKKHNKRIPEAMIVDDMKDIGSAFVSIYNCFRTWWGKLFKTEFFLNHYDMAWECKSPMHWGLDTIIMINYLKECKKLVTLSEPLYNLRVRLDSTYNERPFDHGILWAACSLYRNNIEFLEKYQINSDENIKFIKELHWTYIMEGLERYRNNVKISAKEKLLNIKCILNDKIVGSYMHEMFWKIYMGLEPYLKEIEMQAEEDLTIYDSYIMRLKCFVDSVEADTANPLNFLLLLGGIFDHNNRNFFGIDFMQLPLKGVSYGAWKHIEMHEEAWMYWADNPRCFVEAYCGYWDRTSEVRAAEEELANCWNAGRYEECEALIQEISVAANFNREAIYYRIQLAELLGQHTIAVILAYTVKNIFDYDIELVALCNRILEVGNTNGL